MNPKTYDVIAKDDSPARNHRTIAVFAKERDALHCMERVLAQMRDGAVYIRGPKGVEAFERKEALYT